MHNWGAGGGNQTLIMYTGLGLFDTLKTDPWVPEKLRSFRLLERYAPLPKSRNKSLERILTQGGGFLTCYPFSA